MRASGVVGGGVSFASDLDVAQTSQRLYQIRALPQYTPMLSSSVKLQLGNLLALRNVELAMECAPVLDCAGDPVLGHDG